MQVTARACRRKCRWKYRKRIRPEYHNRVRIWFVLRYNDIHQIIWLNEHGAASPYVVRLIPQFPNEDTANQVYFVHHHRLNPFPWAIVLDVSISEGQAAV